MWPGPGQKKRQKSSSHHQNTSILASLHCVFELSQKVYTDQTGQFPYASSHGYKYIMILLHCDTNAILATPISLSHKNIFFNPSQLYTNLSNSVDTKFLHTSLTMNLHLFSLHIYNKKRLHSKRSHHMYTEIMLLKGAYQLSQTISYLGFSHFQKLSQ